MDRCCVRDCDEIGHNSFDKVKPGTKQQTLLYCLHHTLYCVVGDCEELAIESKFCESCLGGFCNSCRRGAKCRKCHEDRDPVETMTEAVQAINLNAAAPVPEVPVEKDAELLSALVDLDTVVEKLNNIGSKVADRSEYIGASNVADADFNITSKYIRKVKEYADGLASNRPCKGNIVGLTRKLKKLTVKQFNLRNEIDNKPTSMIFKCDHCPAIIKDGRQTRGGIICAGCRIRGTRT